MVDDIIAKKQDVEKADIVNHKSISRTKQLYEHAKLLWQRREEMRHNYENVTKCSFAPKINKRKGTNGWTNERQKLSAKPPEKARFLTLYENAVNLRKKQAIKTKEALAKDAPTFKPNLATSQRKFIKIKQVEETFAEKLEILYRSALQQQTRLNHEIANAEIPTTYNEYSQVQRVKKHNETRTNALYQAGKKRYREREMLKEMSETQYSFTPNINSHYASVQGMTPASDICRNYQSLSPSKETLSERAIELQDRKRQIELRECTFVPTINRRKSFGENQDLNVHNRLYAYSRQSSRATDGLLLDLMAEIVQRNSEVLSGHSTISTGSRIKSCDESATSKTRASVYSRLYENGIERSNMRASDSAAARLERRRKDLMIVKSECTFAPQISPSAKALRETDTHIDSFTRLYTDAERRKRDKTEISSRVQQYPHESGTQRDIVVLALSNEDSEPAVKDPGDIIHREIESIPKHLDESDPAENQEILHQNEEDKVVRNVNTSVSYSDKVVQQPDIAEQELMRQKFLAEVFKDDEI